MDNVLDDSNIKLEVAIEILAAKIASLSKKGYNPEDEELKKLIHERENLYLGDKDIIDKIIEVYGPEMKNNYESVGNK